MMMNGDWLCQCEWAIFETHEIDTPQPISKKIVTGDYVGDTYSYWAMQIRCTYVNGGLWAYGWNITKIIFSYTPFLGTHLQVRPVDGFFTHDG